MHLLIWATFPSPQRKAAFRRELNSTLSPPQVVIDAINTLPATSAPFALTLAGLAAYTAHHASTYDPTTTRNPHMYRSNASTIDEAITRTFGAYATVNALVYCRLHNKTFLSPTDLSASFIHNLLRSMSFVPAENEGERGWRGAPDPHTVATLEKLWILYADHEMTNSTASFLHVASTLADPLSCLSAYVPSGNGPLHAGAVDLAYKHFEKLSCKENVAPMIEDVKAKKYRLFGYGHRIYKTVDPRTRFIREMLDQLAEEGGTGKREGKESRLFEVAMEIDRVASSDEYFVRRNLKANADLYGCFVYTAL